MYHSNISNGVLVPAVDKVEAVEVVLSSSFNNDFELAKQLAEEKLRDILEQTSSLSQPAHHVDIRATGNFAFSQAPQIQDNSLDMLDVVFEDVLSGHTSENISIGSNSSISTARSPGFFDNFDQMIDDQAFFAMSTPVINNDSPHPGHRSNFSPDQSVQGGREASMGIGRLSNDIDASSLGLGLGLCETAVGTIDPSSGALETPVNYRSTSGAHARFNSVEFLDDRSSFATNHIDPSPVSNHCTSPDVMNIESVERQGQTGLSLDQALRPRPTVHSGGRAYSTGRRRTLIQVTPPMSVSASPESMSETSDFTLIEDSSLSHRRKRTERAVAVDVYQSRSDQQEEDPAVSYAGENVVVDAISSSAHLPPTPESSEEIWDDLSEHLSSSSQPWAIDTPEHLPSPDEVLAYFNSHLGDSKLQTSLLLTRLFYAVGSPDALRQLNHAIDLARKSSLPPMCKAGHDLATTVYALDQLDSMTTLSHILRRYYLVRLLEHRSRLERDHNTAKQAWKGTKRRLKYDCAKIDLMKSGGEAAIAADEDNRKSRPTYRSKSQALSDLMQMLYPGLEPLRGNERSSDCAYSRKMAKLKNRLSCARNWYQLEQMFSIGILALIPCGGKYSISIDQVEKLPTDILRILLTYLQQRRGAFLERLSRSLAISLYDILTRTDLSPAFAFEQMDEDTLSDSLYDTDQMLKYCYVSGGPDTEDL